jgi:hypothetical protein
VKKKAENVRPAARALKSPRSNGAGKEVLPELIASPAWPKAWGLAVWTLALAVVCALVLLFVANFGYSRWMYGGEFLSLLKELDGKGTWITAVEGRWKDGSWQMRIREEPVPKDKEFEWSWGYNITGSVFFQRLGELSGKGFILVHQQSYTWPDDTRMYQAVWQQEK